MLAGYLLDSSNTYSISKVMRATAAAIITATAINSNNNNYNNNCTDNVS